MHEPDDTKARPSTRGVACPLQWLPVLLTAASPSLSPPLPPTSRRLRLSPCEAIIEPKSPGYLHGFSLKLCPPPTVYCNSSLAARAGPC